MLMIIYEEPLFLFLGSDKNFIKISQNRYNIPNKENKMNLRNATTEIKKFGMLGKGLEWKRSRGLSRTLKPFRAFLF